MSWCPSACMQKTPAENEDRDENLQTDSADHIQDHDENLQTDSADHIQDHNENLQTASADHKQVAPTAILNRKHIPRSGEEHLTPVELPLLLGNETNSPDTANGLDGPAHINQILRNHDNAMAYSNTEQNHPCRHSTGNPETDALPIAVIDCSGKIEAQLVPTTEDRCCANNIEAVPVSIIEDRPMACCAGKPIEAMPVSVIGDRPMACCAGKPIVVVPVSLIGDKPTTCCAKQHDSAANASSTSLLSSIASSASLSSIASFPEYYVNAEMDISEIKQRVCEVCHQRSADILRACKNFDRKYTNKMNRNQLRLVLRTFCFPLTAAQFDALCEEVGFITAGKMNYVEFLKKLCDIKSEQCNMPEKLSDDLPIDEVELRIREKIQPKLRNVIRAFWLFDINKDGLVQKAEVRRIIRNYCFDISDFMFNQLWKNYDPKDTCIISYKDFLVKLGVSSDRYKKFMPPETVAAALCCQDEDSRSKAISAGNDKRMFRAAKEYCDDPSIIGLPVEEIILRFKKRLHKNRNSLKRIFKMFDYKQDGTILKSDFRGIMNFFVMPMSARVYDLVMKRFDIKLADEGSLYYPHFFDSYCAPYFCSQKEKVPSNRYSEKLDCYPVVQRIKNHVLNPCARLKSVFTRVNSNKEWQITRLELRKALEKGLEFSLKDEEFKDLTTLLDPNNTNIVNCKDFLRLFDGPCDAIRASDNTCGNDEVQGSSDEEICHKDLMMVKKYFDLRGDKLKSKLKHYICKNKADIQKALLISDSPRSGLVSPEQLHHVLNSLCMPISSQQFEELLADFPKNGDLYSYTHFLDAFKKGPDEDTQKWIGTVNKLVAFKSRCPPEIPTDEAEELLRESVTSRKSAMLKDFRALDMCSVGLAFKEDVKGLLNKYSFRFNDKQFTELWQKFPVNQYGQLHYEQFLEEFSLPSPTTTTTCEAWVEIPEPGPSPKPHCCYHGLYGEEKLKETKKKRARKPSAIHRMTQKELLFSEAPHLEAVIKSMEPVVARNVRSIRFRLQRADRKATGTVPFAVLGEALVKSGVFLTKQEEFHLMEYFDTNLSGRINYKKFLDVFVWHG